MASKLKKLFLTSVDLVRAGANQKADICIHKSASPQEGQEGPKESEKGILKQFIDSFHKTPTEAQNEPQNTIEKDFSTFDQIDQNRDKREKLWRYTSALSESLISIMDDQGLHKEHKRELMQRSLAQFDNAMDDLIVTLCEEKKPEIDVICEVEKFNSYHGSDGRFASAPGGGGAVGGISHRTITGGGISIHTKSGKEPKSGYMCATYTDRSQWLSGEDVTNPEKRTEAIRSFMDKNKDVLSDPDNYLGTWFDTESGKISLDISRNFSSREEAVKFATEHNEKAIWDVKNMTEIPTGGTGNNI